jgi:peptidoglycan/LPS O-acetylase OafA/YrhL
MDRPLQCDPRYQSLDVWRGAACLMVVVDHVAIPALSAAGADYPGTLETALRRLVVAATSLGLGPSMFFAISGYCIAASVDSLRRKGKPAGEFLMRRLWRTFPAYWVAILVFAGVTAGLDRLGLERLHRGPAGMALASPGELDAWQWLGNLTLTETWRHTLLGGSESAIYTRVAWTLCYQEQFYFVCFLAVLLAPRRLYRALGVLTALLVGLREGLGDVGMIGRIEGLFPLYWHEFAAGLAAYWRLNVAATRAERTATDLILLAVVGLGLVNGETSAAAAAGFALVLIAARPWDRGLAQAKRLAVVRAVGKRCYSVYLVHLPVCAVGNMVLDELGVSGFWPRVAIMIPAVSALAVGAGCAFYEVVESRFVNLPSWRWRRREPTPALAAC